MRWIKLSDIDYKLFDQEIDSEQNEFMQSHLSIWKKMFCDQGRPFWLHFLITYRSFTLNYGFANDLDKVLLPLCKSKLRRLIDDACIGLHKAFVESSFEEVKKVYNDIVIVVKNRHLIPHLGSQSIEVDPFYHEDTKNAYRYLFCELGDVATTWKVAVGVPFYLKFAGAVCNTLKRWAEEKTLVDKELEDNSKNCYWTVPPEWCNKDFKPGVFEQYLLKFWDKRLVKVLNIDDIRDKFSRKVNYDPCYLESGSINCICDNNHSYGVDDILESTTCKCTSKKIIHKLASGGCCIKTDILPSELTNTIAQAQKVHDTKERLRKKLGKKLKSKSQDNNSLPNECVDDSDWRMKLLEKAEKQFKKESKNLQKKEKSIKSDSENQTKVSDKTKKPDMKEQSDDVIDILYSNNCVSLNVDIQKVTNEKQSCKKVQHCPEKCVDKNITRKDRVQKIVTKSVEDADVSTKQIQVKKDKGTQQKSTLANIPSDQDELAKDLEDIGENLDSIEKSIKEKGGLDFEEFKLLLETGRLLMKESKSLKTEVNSTSSNAEQKMTFKFHVCAQCMKKESAPKTFKKCSRCKLEKFAVPRYYCSKKCQVEDWEESHRDEHLRANKQ